MPDRDVFDRNVKRGWQSAARRMLGQVDDPADLPAVIRALARELQQNGCPGFEQIVGVLDDALLDLDGPATRRLAYDRLDLLRVAQGSAATEVAVEVAKRLLAAPESALADDDRRRDADQRRLSIAARLLAGLADAWMCAAPLLAEIVEQGQVSFQTIRSRRERAVARLISAPKIAALAEQLLSDSSGASVKSPRLPRVKKSRADILVTALTQ